MELVSGKFWMLMSMSPQYSGYLFVGNSYLSEIVRTGMRFREDKKNQLIEHGISTEIFNNELPSFLGGPRGAMMMDQAAVDIIARFPETGFEYVPVTIRDIDTNEVSDRQFYAGNFFDSIECVDYDSSETYIEPGVPGKLEINNRPSSRRVLFANAIGRTAVFRDPRALSTLFCSNEFKEAFEAAGLDFIDFFECLARYD